MNINTLDKITSTAAAEKEMKMHKNQNQKRQVVVAKKKPGRIKRVAAWVRALFARAMAKGRKALAYAREKVKKAYAYCSVKAKAAMNYLAAKLKAVGAVAKRYALALNAKIGSPYESVVRGVNTYIIPVLSAARRHVRLSAIFVVPMAVMASAILAPVGTAIGLSLAMIGTLVYRHYGKRIDATTMVVKNVIRVAGKIVGYAVEIGTLAFIVTAMVVAPVADKIIIGGLNALSVALNYQDQTLEAAQEEDDAPFVPGYPNFAPRTGPATSPA